MTSAVSVPIRANWSLEIPVLVWAMAQGQKCADHNQCDRRVECDGTLLLRQQQCKEHHTKANEDCHQSRLAAEPASLYRLSIICTAFDRRICIFWHVGIDE